MTAHDRKITRSTASGRFSCVKVLSYSASVIAHSESSSQWHLPLKILCFSTMSWKHFDKRPLKPYFVATTILRVLLWSTVKLRTYGATLRATLLAIDVASHVRWCDLLHEMQQKQSCSLWRCKLQNDIDRFTTRKQLVAKKNRCCKLWLL